MSGRRTAGNPMGRTHKPAPSLVFSLLTSTGLLTAVSIWTATHREVGRWERYLFHLLNELPRGLAPVLVAVMQVGSYPAVLGAAVLAMVFRKFWLALQFLLAGNLAYWLAVLCKALVARQRPGQLLADVRIHDTITGALGYPSGHVAVACALGLVLARPLRRRPRRYVWAGIAVVGIARVYVGAHLPVDVVGGLLVGWLAVCLTRLAVGSPGPAQSLPRIRDALHGRGFVIGQLEPMVSDARGSVPLKATTLDGRRLFVKVTGGEQRDADWLYKLYRRARYRGIEDEPPFATAKQKNEHETYLSLLTERAGVRTPRVIATTTDQAGEAVLIQEFVDGRALDTFDAHTLDEPILRDIWQQVALLHRAGIAHRDLRGANVLVRDSSAYLIDLSFAEDSASAAQQARDVMELMVTLAHLASVRSAVSTAVAALGASPVCASLPYLQKPLLSRPTRALLDGQPELLDDIRREVVSQCPGASTEPVKVVRITRRKIALLIMLGLLVHFLLPQIGEVRIALRHLFQASPIGVLASLAASAATYVFSAMTLRAAAGDVVPLRRTIAAQVAASAVNPLAPSSIGGLALETQYLQKQGLSVPTAATAAASTRIGGVISVVLLLPALLPLAGGPGHSLLTEARRLTVLLAVLGALLLLALALAIPKLRRRSRAALRQVAGNLRAIVTSRRGLQLVAACLGLTLAYGACLYFAMLAVGLPLDPSLVPKVVLVCILGEGLSSAAPTPGGLGATEAALVSGLLIYGIPTEMAIAGVLIYRLASFWLPVLPGFVALRRLSHHGDL